MFILFNNIPKFNKSNTKLFNKTNLYKINNFICKIYQHNHNKILCLLTIQNKLCNKDNIKIMKIYIKWELQINKVLLYIVIIVKKMLKLYLVSHIHANNISCAFFYVFSPSRYVLFLIFFHQVIIINIHAVFVNKFYSKKNEYYIYIYIY